MGFDWVGATRVGVSHAIRAYRRSRINPSGLGRRNLLEIGGSILALRSERLQYVLQDRVRWWSETLSLARSFLMESASTRNSREVPIYSDYFTQTRIGTPGTAQTARRIRDIAALTPKATPHIMDGDRLIFVVRVKGQCAEAGW